MLTKRWPHRVCSRVTSVRSTSVTCDIDVLLAHQVLWVKKENLTGGPIIRGCAPGESVHRYAIELESAVCKYRAYLIRYELLCCVQSCPTLCDHMDCSLPAPSVHGILPARILECVSIPFTRVSSWPRDWTCISCISLIRKRILYHCDTWQVLSIDKSI